MAGQDDLGGNPLEAGEGGPRLVDIGKYVAVPRPETGQIVIPGEQDAVLPEEEGQMAGGMARRSEHLHGKIPQPDGLASLKISGRSTRAEMKLVQEERLPERPFLGIEAVPVQENLKIGKRR